MTKNIKDLDPLGEALERQNIVHTVNSGTSADEKTTVGDIIDLLMDSPVNVDAVTGANELLTRNDSDENVTITVQDVLDLVSQVQNVAPPLKSDPNQADLPLIVDSQDSGLLKYITIDNFRALLQMLQMNLQVDNVSKRGSLGIYKDLFAVSDEDQFQVRWGQYQSTSDDEEQFSFHTPFTNECHVCLVSVQGIVTRSALSQSLNPTKDYFFIDRGNDIDGIVPFHMIAIGR